MRHLRLLALVCIALMTLAAVGDADAKRRRRRKKARRSKVVPKAKSRAVAELMGPYKWGMSPKQVLGVLTKIVDKKYQGKINKATDVYAQDQLRRTAIVEKNRIKKTLVKFNGKKTGWDVSIVDKEFWQKNDEGMFFHWENQDGKDQRRFFFFVDNKLWKMFVAFNAEMFENKGFKDFKGIMERRYGRGKTDIVAKVAVVSWRTNQHRLRAIDLTTFYGNFCLAISDAKVEGWISKRRQERNPTQAAKSNIVDSITEDGKEGDLGEVETNVIDSIVGGK